MINDFRATKSANFFVLKRALSNNAIDQLFRNIRAAQPSASQNLFFHRREQKDGARWSAISFLYERKPTFLDDATLVRERVAGFLMIVEYKGHVAVLKSRLDVPSGFSRRYLGRINPSRVDAAVARGNAIFEKIRLRNMSVSKLAVRSKTIEAVDLSNAVGPAGASRYVPQGYAVYSNGNHISATPSTGRIAQRSDKIDHDFLIDYVRLVIDDIADGGEAESSFIRNFARPVDLSFLDNSTEPTLLTIDAAHLADAIFETPKIRLVRQLDGGYVELTKPQIDELFAELDVIFELAKSGKFYEMKLAGAHEPVGKIAFNKARIALREVKLPLATSVEVEKLEHPLGEDPGRMSLRSYLDKSDAFIVLFDSLSLAYIDGTLFRDDVFASGGGNFLKYLRPTPALTDVTSEKGGFAPHKTEFDENSTFGAIARSIAASDELLVCDDLNDEWADFIGVNNSADPPHVTFYHGKHGNLSLGAGSFHVSVSQAIKNLGRLRLEASEMAEKFARWRTTYNNDGVATNIHRTARGNPAELEAVFAEARSAPDGIRRVYIVTSSLSRKAVEKALDDIAKGEAPSPHFVQLYWLLMGFFSACTDVGAFGSIICRE